MKNVETRFECDICELNLGAGGYAVIPVTGQSGGLRLTRRFAEHEMHICNKCLNSLCVSYLELQGIDVRAGQGNTNETFQRTCGDIGD